LLQIIESYTPSVPGALLLTEDTTYVT